MRKKFKEMTKKAWSICTKKEYHFILASLVLTVIFVLGNPSFVYANTALNGVRTQLNNLLNLVSTVVSSMGAVITLWGISEWGLSLQGGNGGMMEAQGFKRIIGGIVMILATNLLAIFTA